MIDDEKCIKFELQPGEAIYAEYHVEMTGSENPNNAGKIRYNLRKVYGTAHIWLSETIKRPNPNSQDCVKMDVMCHLMYSHRETQECISMLGGFQKGFKLIQSSLEYMLNLILKAHLRSRHMTSVNLCS